MDSITRSVAAEAAPLVASLERRRGFAVDVTHLSIAGRCAGCTAALADESPQLGRSSGQSSVGTPTMLKPPST